MTGVVCGAGRDHGVPMPAAVLWALTWLTDNTPPQEKTPLLAIVSMDKAHASLTVETQRLILSRYSLSVDMMSRVQLANSPV